MVRDGRVTGYMSIRSRATEEEVAAVTPLYQALNEGRCNKRIAKGLVVSKGWRGNLPATPLRWRVRTVMSVLFIALAAVLVGTGAVWLPVLASGLLMLCGSALFEW